MSRKSLARRSDLVKSADRLAGARGRIIVALDVPTRSRALALVRRLRGRCGFFKVGSQLFTATGPNLVRELAGSGEQVFLDLKFHDIPHIVAEACVCAADLGASLLTVHTSGGPKMLRAARQALEKHCRGKTRPKLLGVTLLTSLDAGEARRVGFSGGVEHNVVRLARLARQSGCDGVIAAPSEVAAVRRACGKKFVIVTPGIRLAGGRRAPDQARVAMAPEAIRNGADYAVVGRAILESPSPAKALDALAAELRAALGQTPR